VARHGALRVAIPQLNKSLDKIQGWFHDLGVDQTQQAKEGVQKAAPEIRTTLLSGVAAGIEGLKSLLFFLAFAILSTLFVLKDGPVMHRFINRHMGVPEPVANVVTTNVAKSLRSYFLAVTIIAAFNAILIGGAALILGVPRPRRCPSSRVPWCSPGRSSTGASRTGPSSRPSTSRS
jgi:predicted PurR-regulated permease PerM